MRQSLHHSEQICRPSDVHSEPPAIARTQAGRRPGRRAFRSTAVALAIAAWLGALQVGTGGALPAPSPAPSGSGRDSSFPDVNEVLQGRVFKTKFDRDVFFLQRIRNDYPAHWPSLLGTNIIVKDYVEAPDKLLRFVEELGAALAGTDDFAATTNLAAITSRPPFYANTNVYHPEILRAAAEALIKIGPDGRRALADSFSEDHYCADPASLEVLADAVGQSGVSNAPLTAALAATAFTFTATNGGSYPRCTREATRSLLGLPEGIAAVGIRLNPKTVLADPSRFQAVVEGIAAAQAVGLATNLVAVGREVAAKLDSLATVPGAYRDALQGYQSSSKQTIEQLRESPRKDGH